MKSEWINITSILVFALLFRLFVFASFALGNDPAHADRIHIITNPSLPLS